MNVLAVCVCWRWLGHEYFCNNRSGHLLIQMQLLTPPLAAPLILHLPSQHLAQLGHLLPPEYVTEAQTCLDDCPKSSTSDVRKVIEEELGASPEKLFDEFSHQPIASASLAQVHIARTKGEDNPGRKIAIKVQHRGLRETCVGDLEAVGLAVRLVAHAFPAFRLGWLVDEVAPHLPLELDFKHEAKNCRRAAKIFEKWEDVVVPEVQYTFEGRGKG